MASFYVTNLPDHVQYVDLRKAFEVCGILSNVYVARNARGQNYGFVRYINVKDVAKLQKVLNNVFFGQNKVWANVARFDRFGEVKKEFLKGLEDGKIFVAVGGKNKLKIVPKMKKKE
jgi:RNA recognition motif-containing protein